MAHGQAPSSTRTLWKGAISFGLVHVPVALHSATANGGIDFDWLDRRTMDPVGYKRINKKTGKDIASEDVVKGVEYEDGRYVVLSAEEIAAAYPRTTQTIEIEAFIDADEIPFLYLERPYYTAPINRGEKVYALLREALRESGKVGVAKVVIQSKQHLAVLIPCGPGLVLNLLRWGDEIRSAEALKLPPSGTKGAGIRDAEMKMARQLIDDMSEKWDADHFRDSFKEEIMRLVERKARAGDLAAVTRLEDDVDGGGEVIDLTVLLKRSLGQGGRRSGAGAAKPGGREPVQLSMVPPAEKKARAKKPGTKASAPQAPATPAGSTARSAPNRKLGLSSPVPRGRSARKAA